MGTESSSRQTDRTATVSFTLTASDGEALYCDARYPAGAEGRLPVIIFVHGFKGFKDWGGFPYVCEQLAREGFCLLSFNLSHNGTEAGGSDFSQLEKFAENTYSREVREIGEVVDAVATGKVPENLPIRSDAIGLLGHSRGGGGVIVAGRNSDRVRAVVAWAPVSSFDRYTARQKERWRADGHLDIPNARTGQMMRMNVSALDDLEAGAEALDVVRAASELRRPLLILHGEQDLSVTIDHGERLAGAGDPALTSLVRIPKTGHTFGAVHPFQGTTDALEQAIKTTASFFTENLKAQ